MLSLFVMPQLGESIQRLESSKVDGVTVHRHPLEREASRMNNLAARIGMRLMMWTRKTSGMAEPLKRVVGRDPETGKNLYEPVLDQVGQPVMVPVLPDEDFRESWALYQKTTSQLLVEQRARAAMAPNKGIPEIDDATYERELKRIVAETIKTMPEAEFKKLAAARVSKKDTKRMK